jgi:LAGLIDADG DNA endonuclease family protein
MELAYIAGLFDGEGCVSIRRFFRANNKSRKPCEMYTLWVQVTNVDPRLVYPLKEKFGGSVHITKHKSPNQRDTHVWIATSKNALDFLKAIRPWLLAKSEQADIAISFQEAKQGPGGGRGAKVSTSYRERERQQYAEIAALKFRTFNPTDFGMGANSGDSQNGQPRAKQGESLGVCNEQVPPSTEKICSDPCGNTGSAAEMTAPCHPAE